MTRYFWGIIALICWSANARADMVPAFENLPSSYTPGTPFDFNVRIPGLTDLGLYNIELVFGTTSSPPMLSATATPPTLPGAYPFPTLDNYLASGNIFGSEYRLTLSDFILAGPGVNTTAGVNDLVASITVSPGLGLSGPIRLDVESTSLIFDTPAGTPILVDLPASVDIPPNTAAVPTPPAILLIGIGGVVVIGVRKFGMRNSK